MGKTNRKGYSFINYFYRYFDAIEKMTLANLLLCVPLLLWIGALALITTWTGQLNILAVFAVIPMMAPFLAGGFYLCVKLLRGQEISPLKDLIRGIKNSGLFFFVDSLFAYVIVLGLYITFEFYRGLLTQPVFIAAFIMSLLFTWFFLSFQFSLLTMSVTVELKVSSMIKNAVMMTAGGFFQHLKVLFAFVVMAALLSSGTLLSGNMTVGLVAAGLCTLVFLPMMSCYTIVYQEYQVVEKIILQPAAPVSEKPQETALPDIEVLRELSDGDPEEYVYLEGRMIKRSKLRKLLERQQAGSDSLHP